MISYPKPPHRWLYMLALVLAGEIIFALPFHLTRFYRPTVLELFELTATQLGAAQGVYGLIALLAYFPGGALADKFPAYKLIACSLWSTAVGGVYLMTFPGYLGTTFVFGFFGITTILLFWAALIRATREWGDINQQGRAYGLLEGGRGVVAAGFGSLGVILFSLSFPDGYAAATFTEKQSAFRTVVLGYTFATAATGFLVWLALKPAIPQQESNTAKAAPHHPMWRHLGIVSKLPAVWLQALVVVCAYVGYKGFDNYSLYAVEVYGLDPVEAAELITLSAWIRPLAAVSIGLLGDRFGMFRMLLLCFLLLLFAQLSFALDSPIPHTTWVLGGNIALTCIAMFGLRALYFSIFEVNQVRRAATGTAVGLVSVVGFTPDIFVNLVAGILIDASPGAAGHQYFFLFLAAFSLLGIVATLGLMSVRRARIKQY